MDASIVHSPTSGCRWSIGIDVSSSRSPSQRLRDPAKFIGRVPTLPGVAEPLKDTSRGDDQERVQAARRILRPRRLVISAAVAACACAVAAVALASGGGDAPKARAV